MTHEQADAAGCPTLGRDSDWAYVDADSECWTKHVQALAAAKPATATVRIAIPSTVEREGPRLWAELHRFTLTADLTHGDKEARQWLAAFAARIPCGACTAHWNELLMNAPPDYSSNENFFLWSVARHNDVNRALDKPLMSFDAARALWSATPSSANTPPPAAPNAIHS